MLRVRAEQLERFAEARRDERVDEVLAHTDGVADSQETVPSIASAPDARRRLAAEALDQADRFLFVAPEVRLRFAGHCVRRGGLFEAPLQYHLRVADLECPGRQDSTRLELLLDLQRRGCGAAPPARPARDPASQPSSLSDSQR